MSLILWMLLISLIRQATQLPSKAISWVRISVFFFFIRPHSLHCLVHAFQQGLKQREEPAFFLVGHFCIFWPFVCVCYFLWQKCYGLCIKKQLLFMAEEKIIKTSECQFFFLIGHKFSSSEESWAKEYGDWWAWWVLPYFIFDWTTVS